MTVEDIREHAARAKRFKPKPNEAGQAATDIADFSNPVAAAGSIVQQLYTREGHRTLHFWQGEFHWWAGSHYAVFPVADVREMLYRVGPPASKAPIKKRTVDDVLDALRAAATFGRDVAAAAPWVQCSRPRIEGQRVRMYEGIRLRNPDDREVDDDAE
jgi:hypothetical protein